MSPSQYNEKELRTQVAQSDPHAFRLLFDTYRQKIYSLAMYLTHTESLAEEIVQDVFAAIWQNREQLERIDYFNSYLRTITRNITSNYLRRMATEKIVLRKMVLQQDKEDLSTSDTITFNEYQQVLSDAIKGLPPQHRKAYLLSRQQGMKYEEIATEMQISLHTVKEYIKKALAFIRLYLDKHLQLILTSVIVRFLQ